ncbi:stalk domain-containing protein [Paenibacillus spongiae]|uniref:GDSL-type esterase/lipase family protein n=1 Tax=Paenibacillus spongiae TaxID=2909671 RepID=A0ABY5SCA8_9BACL|nr:stalk domain-containing protein [Paenibacillus spongiae]UVI31597.1 GDSL-type esterase/lipase family protein [Paenibacillus spongiae]
MSRKFRKTSLTAAALSAALLAGSLPASAAAAAQERVIIPTQPAALTAFAAANTGSAIAEAAAPFRIVAVGDSITAGYELGMTEKSAVYGYVDRLYEQALYHGAAEMQNFGILGLKSAGLNRWLEAAEQGKPIGAEEAQAGVTKYPNAVETIARSAELRTALTQADLIVMTIGGNDFLPLFDEMRSRSVTPEELTALLDKMLEGYMSALEGSLSSVAKISPEAQIVLTDQYLPVPKPSKLNKAVTEEQYAVLLQGVAKLREQVEAAAAKLEGEGVRVKVANVSEPFAGHELSYTSIIQGDSHPKQAGYDVIAESFAKSIWGSYRKPLPLPAGVPLHVIVGGKEVAGANKPIVKNGTTFLPMRDIANALGATLGWDGKTQTATIKADGVEVAFTIGAKTMKVNGQSMPLETPAYLEKTGKTSSTYLPLAALSRGLGYQVIYRKPIQTVFINS